jgi:hypothetical protein
MTLRGARRRDVYTAQKVPLADWKHFDPRLMVAAMKKFLAEPERNDHDDADNRRQ